MEILWNNEFEVRFIDRKVIRDDNVLPVGHNPNCTILKVDLRNNDVTRAGKEEVHAVLSTCIDFTPVN